MILRSKRKDKDRLKGWKKNNRKTMGKSQFQAVSRQDLRPWAHLKRKLSSKINNNRSGSTIAFRR